jgi:hypothetical protein
MTRYLCASPPHDEPVNLTALVQAERNQAPEYVWVTSRDAIVDFVLDLSEADGEKRTSLIATHLTGAKGGSESRGPSRRPAAPIREDTLRSLRLPHADYPQPRYRCTDGP